METDEKHPTAILHGGRWYVEQHLYAAAIRERDELRTALLVTRRHVDIVSDRITRVLSSPTAPATDQAPETGEVKG
jgi:hypothetical protein